MTMRRHNAVSLLLIAVAAGPTVTMAQRPANAPPLVPVRLNVDGNFRIAPPYVPDAAFTEKPNVPKGRVIRFTMNSAESRIFPTGPVGRGTGGGRGAAAPGPPAEPPQHQTFERQVAVYVPAGTCPTRLRRSSSSRTSGGSSRRTRLRVRTASRGPTSRSSR